MSAPIVESRTPVSAPPARARLGAYLSYQMYDFIVERGIGLLIISVLLGVMVAQTVMAMHASRAGMGPSAVAMQMVQPIIFTMLGSFVPLFVVIAINGIVSSDRTAGYYRLLFSKPVSPVAYYAQRFAVHGVGLLVCVLLLLAGLATADAAPSPVAFLAYVAVVYVLVGGIMFLVSSLTRYDWMVAALVWAVTELLYSRYGRMEGVVSWLLHALPPLHQLSALRTALSSGWPPAGDIIWPVSYGLGCILSALVVLKHRQMAK